MARLLIIGGSDPAIAAALRAWEVDARAEMTVVVADHFPNYSIGGLPFNLSGEVPDWHSLAHRTVPEFTEHGITLLMGHRAMNVDPDHKVVTIVDQRSDKGPRQPVELTKRRPPCLWSARWVTTPGVRNGPPDVPSPSTR